MTDPIDCLNCEHSETCKYSQILMCNLSMAPAWMTYKERECKYNKKAMEVKP